MIRFEESNWPPDWHTGRVSFLSYLDIAAHAIHFDFKTLNKLIALDQIAIGTRHQASFRSTQHHQPTIHHDHI